MIYQYRRVNLLFQSESSKSFTGQSHMQQSHIYVVKREAMFAGRVVGVQTKWDKPVFGFTNYVIT